MRLYLLVPLALTVSVGMNRDLLPATVPWPCHLQNGNLV